MSNSRSMIAVLGDSAEVHRFKVIFASAAADSDLSLHIRLPQDSAALASHAPALLVLAGDSCHSQLGSVLTQLPAGKVLVLGSDHAAHASWCLRRGATEYVCWETLDANPVVLANLLHTLLQDSSNEPLLRSEAATKIYGLARRVAPSDVPVLIHGDSGSGKEVLARFVHQQSLRSDGPFVAVNCAAIPENMLEATLFGHEKGAFTGADRKRDGKFLAANEGTLLLDEVTEMPIELQAKLLRAIQEREIEPLGARDPVATNVRIIATSNRNLKEAIAQDRLRLDLYYRLNVFPLQLPTLAQRCEDILPLAEFMVSRYQTSRQVQDPDPPMQTSGAFDASAQAALLAHDWPGNVRELENRVQRALILADEEQISAADLGLDSPTGSEFSDIGPAASALSAPAPKPATVGDSFKAQRDAQESALILQALQRHDGQRKATAAALGMSERTLRYRLQRMRDAGVRVS